MDIEQQFVDWLKDAYFMELHYAKVLEEHLGATRDYPRTPSLGRRAPLGDHESRV
jgi:ferritin-like metal-binding protein YciE